MAIIGESGEYTGEHSLTFTDMYGNVRNTNTDWHLVPTQRPSVAPPEVKTKIIENPGGDGIIDVTETVTGFPLYGQRKGSWDFYVLNGWYSWYELYSELLNFFHGKNIQVILDDDPTYYYNGRVTINQWASEAARSKITLDYDFDPYKLSTKMSTQQEWLWDDFDFRTGIILSTAMDHITFSGTHTVIFSGAEVGRRPVTPVFHVNSGTCSEITLYNKELWGDTGLKKTGLVTGEDNHWMDMIFSGFNPSNEIKLVMKGTGVDLSILYRPGKL